jgi:hypothetical protein
MQEYCDAGNLGDYNIIHGDRQRGQLPTGHAMVGEWHWIERFIRSHGVGLVSARQMEAALVLCLFGLHLPAGRATFVTAEPAACTAGRH